MRITAGLLAIAILGSGTPSAMGGQERPPQELFSSRSVLHFTLEADFEALKKDRTQESEERPARLVLKAADGGLVNVPLKIKTRGRYRLQENICPFPPLRLNFQESNPQGTVFDGQDKLKLVTHCHEWESFEQNELEEYLAYRLYNELTDISFRVRLAEITYRDVNGSPDPLTRMGFLIEDEEALAARVGGMILDIPGARATAFDPAQMGVMFLFQYMIGNIDWSTANSQNLKVLRIGSDHFAIPYDFDWSGLVDPPYVGPSPLTERLHDSVRERVYLGVCWDEIDYPSAFSVFMEREDALFEAIRDVPGLDEVNIKSASDYLEEFFAFIQDPARAEGDLRRMCRRG